jgi:AP-1 complex subunit beta-1
MRDVFRKYPQKFSAVLKDLFQNMKAYDEPEAKSAMVWIIGEYAEIFTNTQQILAKFIESFHDEPPMMQTLFR